MPKLPQRLKIPAKNHSLLLFRDNDGAWVTFTTVDKKFALKYLRGSTKIAKRMVLTTKTLSRREKKDGVKAHEVVEFHFAIPPTERDAKQKAGSTRAVFKMVLELPDPPSPGKAWRTNYTPHTPRADAGNGNDKGKNNAKGR